MTNYEYLKTLSVGDFSKIVTTKVSELMEENNINNPNYEIEIIDRVIDLQIDFENWLKSPKEYKKFIDKYGNEFTAKEIKMILEKKQKAPEEYIGKKVGSWLINEDDEEAKT